MKNADFDVLWYLDDMHMYVSASEVAPLVAGPKKAMLKAIVEGLNMFEILLHTLKMLAKQDVLGKLVLGLVKCDAVGFCFDLLTAVIMLRSVVSGATNQVWCLFLINTFGPSCSQCACFSFARFVFQGTCCWLQVEILSARQHHGFLFTLKEDDRFCHVAVDNIILVMMVWMVMTRMVLSTVT